MIIMTSDSIPNYEYKFGGALPLDNRTYVTRKADDELYRGLIVGEFCYVLNSRQMGKSSLRVRIMERLQVNKITCVAIDLNEIGTSITQEKWYLGLINILANHLDLYSGFDLNHWSVNHNLLSPVQQLSKFVEEIFLKNISGNIVIFIDEIDTLLSLKDFSRDDFFALLRLFYNQRVDKQSYKRLTFCLLGVATPSDLINDKKRTPFNIGRAIELNGFKFDEAKPLAEGLEGKVNNPQEILQQILDWTGGQPFLTQKLCHLISDSDDNRFLEIEEFVRSHIINNWESQDNPEHLKTISDRILQDEQKAGQLLGLYKQIWQKEVIKADENPVQMELRLTGLVVKRNGKLEVYNRIYEKVFNQKWIDKELDNLRPPIYREAITAWLASNRKQESYLLRIDELKTALTWADGRNLSREDNDFLNASQEHYRQELEKLGKPTNIQFKDETAFSVLDLIYLCDKYPDIAEDYLFNSDYLEQWLFVRSETDLARFSRKISNSYKNKDKQERRRGLEIFIRKLCEHLKQPQYPQIFFEPNKLELGEIPIGYKEKISLKIGNKGRGFAWGFVINPDLPGLKVPEKFDSSTNITFNINLDTLEVKPGHYQGNIFIVLEEMEYPCTILISYQVKRPHISKPEQLDFGIISHGKSSKSLIITCDNGGIIKGFAMTEMEQIQITQHSFQGNSLEFSLTIDTTSLEAGVYQNKIIINTNAGEFSIPIYFNKTLDSSILNKLATLSTVAGTAIGIVMLLARTILNNHLAVGLDDAWLLSYPPEVSRASYLTGFFPFSPLTILGIPDIQLTCATFGILLFLLIVLIFRSYLKFLQEKIILLITPFLNLINKSRENNQSNYSWDNEWYYNYNQRYYPRITRLLLIIVVSLILFLWLGIFIINLLINIFAWFGSSFIIIVDLITYPLKIIGLQQPSIGWSIVGFLMGGFMGLILSLRHLKQYSYLSKVHKMAMIISIILLLTGLITFKFKLNTDFFPKIILTDNFQYPSKNWNKDISAIFKNGGLFHPPTKNEKLQLSIWSDKNQIIKNLDFSSDVTKINGNNDSEFGIVAQTLNKNKSSLEDKFYYLLIKGNGEFAMGKLLTSNKWEHKVGWQYSTSIKPGNNLN